jgi:hypothetical protein
MSIFKRKSQGTLVPIHPDNAKTKDWVVLLEAATIVGESHDKLRVALTTQERKLVRKKKLFQKPQYFLVVDGYDPRIHALYFCPQLYRKEDSDLNRPGFAGGSNSAESLTALSSIPRVRVQMEP